MDFLMHGFIFTWIFAQDLPDPPQGSWAHGCMSAVAGVSLDGGYGVQIGKKNNVLFLFFGNYK